MKHLGIKQVEKRSLVAYPVHFPLALYVACVVYHTKVILFNLYVTILLFYYALISNSNRIKWTLDEMRRQPSIILFSRFQKAGDTRDDAVAVPGDTDRIFLAPTVGIRHGLSHINIRSVHHMHKSNCMKANFMCVTVKSNSMNHVYQMQCT